MKYKIIGAILALTGFFVIAKFHQHLLGLMLMVVGFYLAIKIGMEMD